MNQGFLPAIHDQARRSLNQAGWRNIMGDLAERLAAERLGAERLNTGNGIVIGGRIYCYDLRRGRVFFEVKSVGRSGTAIIYAARLDKDREFAAIHPLCYVFVSHRVQTPQPSAYEAKLLLDNWARIFVIPFCYIEAVCVTKTPRILNKRFMERQQRGDCQRGYEKGGYMVRLREFTEAFPQGRIQ